MVGYGYWGLGYIKGKKIDVEQVAWGEDLRVTEKRTHPFRVSVNLWDSPSISKILTVLSEEQVANRRP